MPYKPYEESDEVKQAYMNLQTIQGQKPADYQNQYQVQLDSIMDQINNRKPFSYNLGGDALYQQYKNQYMHGGKLAMQDTMGQAAALTGGYGSSYAQQAGQQAYQGYLNGLNDKLPDLYNMALQRYQLQGNDLKDQYSMLAQKENQDYGRYQDAYNMWMQGLKSAEDRYDRERQLDYQRYADDLDYQYRAERDAVSDAQWQAQYDENKRRYDQEWDYQLAQDAAKRSGGISSGTPIGDPDDENTPVPTKEELIQRYYELRDIANSTANAQGINPDGGIGALEYLKGLISEGVISDREAYDLMNSRQGYDNQATAKAKEDEKKKTAAKGNGGR